jgi:Cu/Ag efflux protein CusF
MKTYAVASTIIGLAVIALGIFVFQQSQEINALKKEQELLSQEILRAKQELAGSWREDHHHAHGVEEWPRFHDASGVLLSKSGNRVVVDEDEIPGYMRAMIMSYDVENPDQLEGLKEGDKIKLRLKETESSLTVEEISKR